MYESRCGICCNECVRKNDVGCLGCLKMEKPFWGGECEVKSCCENKELNHCGECADFPCQIFKDMGKEQGFDHQPRLENCKRWLKQEEKDD